MLQWKYPGCHHDNWRARVAYRLLVAPTALASAATARWNDAAYGAYQRCTDNESLWHPADSQLLAAIKVWWRAYGRTPETIWLACRVCALHLWKRRWI